MLHGLYSAAMRAGGVVNMLSQLTQDQRLAAESAVRVQNYLNEDARKQELHEITWKNRDDEGKRAQLLATQKSLLNGQTAQLKEAESSANVAATNTRRDSYLDEAAIRREDQENRERRAQELHGARISNLKSDNVRKSETHTLNVLENLHRIGALRRQTGFSEGLTKEGEKSDNVMTSLAWAAATMGAASFSSQHQEAAKAYTDRIYSDTGRNVGDFAPGKDGSGPAASSSIEDVISNLAAEFARRFVDLDRSTADAGGAGPDTGEVIGEAAAAASSAADPGEGVYRDPGPSPETSSPEPGADHGVGA